MTDFYVNGATGDDSAPGTSAEPVKTIFCATELAAETPGDSGTIYVSAGIYDLANGDNFPLLVPPRFSLEGTSRIDLPVIRFDGRARGSDGVVPHWNNIVLAAGVAVRNIVIEADPYTDIPPCTTMSAVRAVMEGVTVENVEVRARDGDIERGFHVAISGGGNRGLLQEVRFQACRNGVIWNGGACDLTNSRFDTASAAFGEGDHSIASNTFVNSTVEIHSNTNVRVVRNTFQGDAEGVDCAIWVHGPPGVADDGPFIEENVIRDYRFGIICEGTGVAHFRMNTIERFSHQGVWIRNDAAPVFENSNRIGTPTDRHARLLTTERNAHPAFEYTVFDSRLASPMGGHPLVSIVLHSPVDFGGGERSSGNNSFGMANSVALSVADIPGGGIITAHNNLWPYLAPLFFNAAPGTRVETDGARLDPDR